VSQGLTSGLRFGAPLTVEFLSQGPAAKRAELQIHRQSLSTAMWASTRIPNFSAKPNSIVDPDAIEVSADAFLWLGKCVAPATTRNATAAGPLVFPADCPRDTRVTVRIATVKLVPVVQPDGNVERLLG
jgi:hypothetical protein